MKDMLYKNQQNLHVPIKYGMLHLGTNVHSTGNDTQCWACFSQITHLTAFRISEKRSGVSPHI